MEASLWTLVVCILISSVWSIVGGTLCHQGWFGDQCQYKCRCQNENCNLDGSCKSGVTCQGGWFGPECQYADMAYNHSSVAFPVVVDGDDSTCLNNVDSDFIKFDLGEYFSTDWLRIRISKPALLSTLEIDLGDNRKCVGISIVDRYTMDCYTDTDYLLKYVKIFGPGIRHMCSLHVSGGRIFVSTQNVSQRSTFLIHYAGDDFYYSTVKSVYEKKDARKTVSCSISKERVHYSIMSFIHPKIILERFVLYFQDEVDSDTLKKFKDHYVDTDGDRSFTSLDEFIIKTTDYNKDNMPNICDIDVYGDSQCDPGWYGRDCEHRCNCAGSNPCFVSTGGCSGGCAVGFHGENCTRTCPDNTYGQACATNCSQFCVQNYTNPQSCDRTSGACFFGCVQGYKGLMCQERCDPGWFGVQCKYKCQCRAGHCDTDGSCKSGISCQGGWFGPACQYVDLAFNTSTVAPLSVVVDGDDSTCLIGVNSTFIYFDLGDQFSLTWLRFRLNKPEHVSTLVISFGLNGSVECTNAKKSKVDRFTMDVHCEVDQMIQYIHVSGDGMHHLCSLYVSGGRNVSLGQNVTQTTIKLESTFIPEQELSPSSIQFKNSLEKFRGVPLYNASLKVTFTLPQIINMIRIYNPADREPYLLQELRVTVIIKDGAEMVIFEDNRPQAISQYTIQIKQTIALGVFMTVNKSQNILGSHQVGTYGDLRCKSGRYGRNCELKCNCAGSDPCFVSTGGCTSGCAAGFKGENCRQACDVNTYGPGCTFNCSPFCIQSFNNPQSCHHISGACLHGCVSGHIGYPCHPQPSPSETEKKTSNLTAVWGVLGVICSLLVLVFIYVFMGRRQKRRRRMYQIELEDVDAVGFIPPFYRDSSLAISNRKVRSQRTKQPRLPDEPPEDVYDTLPDLDDFGGKPYKETYDDDKTAEASYNQISESTNSGIYDDTDCYNQIYGSTNCLAVNSQEKQTDISDKQETTKGCGVHLSVKQMTDINSCYRNMPEGQNTADTPRGISGLEETNRATSSVIYDDTVGPTQPYNSERTLTELISGERTDFTEKLKTTGDTTMNEYNHPENCVSSNNNSYSNIQDIQQPTDAPYEQLVGLQPNIGAPTPVIVDETDDPAEQTKKENFPEPNPEVRRHISEDLKNPEDSSKIMYEPPENCKTSEEDFYRNIHGVQHLPDKPYIEMKATSTIIYDDTIGSNTTNNTECSSTVYAQQIKTKITDTMEESSESLYTNPDTLMTSTGSCYRNIQDVQSTTEETYEEIK